MLSLIDSAPIGKAPALVAITSPAGAEQVVSAGRLLTRIWTRLKAEGVAVHPYYVIPDQLQRLKQKRVPEHLITRARDLELKASRLFALHDCCLSDYLTALFSKYFWEPRILFLTLIAPVEQSWKVA